MRWKFKRRDHTWEEGIGSAIGCYNDSYGELMVLVAQDGKESLQTIPYNLLKNHDIHVEIEQALSDWGANLYKLGWSQGYSDAMSDITLKEAIIRADKKTDSIRQGMLNIVSKSKEIEKH